MRIVQVLLFVVVVSSVSLCFPGGVLENVRKIQVDPTVIEQPEKVKDAVAANLVRYNLRAAVRDALFEEGDSPLRAHFALDEFSPEGTAKRLIGLGSGRSIYTVDGRLVIQDASGKELASVKIHVHGSVASSPADGNNSQGRQPASDLERRLLEEIERLK
ncbi:MAG: hypothetical protein ACLQVL_15310 [Terriglobia bacterium]